MKSYRKYPEKTKQEIVARFNNGETAKSLAAELNVDVSSVYTWVRAAKEDNIPDTKPNPILDLENFVKALSEIIEMNELLTSENARLVQRVKELSDENARGKTLLEQWKITAGKINESINGKE
jgi:transposase-like protein